MGADTKSLRIRIRSVDSTLHLTKAMGLVASSKIRRATQNMGKSREYTAAMEEVMAQLRSSPDCAKSPYMIPRGAGTRLIVIAGDRGLAGGYNANIFRLASTFPEADILPIGKRACERFGEGYISSERFSGEDAAKAPRSRGEEMRRRISPGIGFEGAPAKWAQIQVEPRILSNSP